MRIRLPEYAADVFLLPGGCLVGVTTQHAATNFQIKGKTMQPENEDDYVWSFSIQPKANIPENENPLVEMVRVFLEDFLNMGFVTYQGKRVRIDGFALSNAPKELYAIFPEESKPGADSDG